jgi:ankyrin repeat protein
MSREVLKAILKGNIDKVDAFINEGIGINDVTEKEKWNYLHRALISVAIPPPLEMIQHLISCGVDVNAVDVYGNTPLHYAARLKNTGIIKALLIANANVNHVNNDGVSPLREMLLTKPFDYESIKLLLESGADVSQKVKDGISIKHFAEAIANEDNVLMDLLRNYP